MTTRSKRRKLPRLELSVPEILAWADAHHRRLGAWPTSESGLVSASLDQTWRAVDNALRYGLRGLAGGSSLARLLAEHRGVRNLGCLPTLTHKQILAWADAHHERTGNWPNAECGPIPEAPGETWRAVDQALRVPGRGLTGGSSLAQLLARQRKVRNLQRLPRLTIRQILAWADAHHRRTGAWPNAGSGAVFDAPGETWSAIHTALSIGRRGLPGGSSLARLLATRRGVPHPDQVPALTAKQILAWARAHRNRTGAWPNSESGPVVEAPEETWKRVDQALRGGYRGLRGGLTLAALVAGRRKATGGSDLPRLTVKQVLAWADAHHQRTETWPHSRSGPIADAPGETWRAVDQALRTNQRGLTGGLTLVRLLTQERGWRNRRYPPRLTPRQILAWAEAHHQHTGTWPTARSGSIPEVPGETWRAVDQSLRSGARGLRGRVSLAGLLAQKRGARNRTNLPRLTHNLILAWADAHRRRNGVWPTTECGPVADTQGETWKGIDLALRQGYRGLRGGISLAGLLAQKRGARNRANLPRLSTRQVLTWARAHRRRTGAWPNAESGPVVEAPGETWKGVDLAMRYGHRGLSAGDSLAQLLRRLNGQ